jgi:hypothetical protein
MTPTPVDPLYEALRTWALHPTAVRPPGWAQVLGGGLAHWMQAVQSLPVVCASQATTVHTERPRPGELPRLLAAMIAEVYP